jgi:hypothetical protein
VSEGSLSCAEPLLVELPVGAKEGTTPALLPACPEVGKKMVDVA